MHLSLTTLLCGISLRNLCIFSRTRINSSSFGLNFTPLHCIERTATLSLSITACIAKTSGKTCTSFDKVLISQQVALYFAICLPRSQTNLSNTADVGLIGVSD